jgi:SPP1 gp7 family putative phage head morphogenesis protein
MMMAKSSEYWRNRAELLEDAKNRAAGRYTAEIEKQFNLAQKTLDEQIEQWYGRFADNNGITLSEARKWLTGKDLAEFKWDVNEYIKHGKEAALNPAFIRQLENASARFHISRLEALKLKTQNTIEQLYNGVRTGNESLFGKIYRDSYYHTAFELQKGFSIGFDVAALSNKHVESVLSKPWTLDKRTFSDRIWQQKNNLITEIHTRLTQNAILGTPPDEAIKAIAKRFNVSKHQAGRLVMTESAYFMNAAQADAYEVLDVEEFEIIGTLDNSTCPECGSLDGVHMPMSQFEAGVTAPPYHCFCRCCTAPYFSDNGGERFARDAEGKGYYVPADMTYEDWKNKSVASQATNASQGLQAGAGGGTIQESAAVVQMMDALPAPIVNDPTSRQAFAEKIIDNMGIDRSNIPVTVERISNNTRGFCKFDASSSDAKVVYNQYTLQSQDPRSVEYQTKTAFHEAYHLKAEGKSTDVNAAAAAGRIEDWKTIEETFAEVSANYSAKVYGITDKLHPSYPKYLIKTLPRLKQTSRFSACAEISDFGKIALEERLTGSGSEWLKYYDSLFGTPFDDDAYFLKYLPYIEKNKQDLLQKFFENNPNWVTYKNQALGDIDNAIDGIKKGGKFTGLIDNEEILMRNLLLAAMNETGVL